MHFWTVWSLMEFIVDFTMTRRASSFQQPRCTAIIERPLHVIPVLASAYNIQILFATMSMLGYISPVNGTVKVACSNILPSKNFSDF